MKLGMREGNEDEKKKAIKNKNYLGQKHCNMVVIAKLGWFFFE